MKHRWKFCFWTFYNHIIRGKFVIKKNCNSGKTANSCLWTDYFCWGIFLAYDPSIAFGLVIALASINLPIIGMALDCSATFSLPNLFLSPRILPLPLITVVPYVPSLFKAKEFLRCLTSALPVLPVFSESLSNAAFNSRSSGFNLAPLESTVAPLGRFASVER